MATLPIYPMSDYDRQIEINKIEQREREYIQKGITPPAILSLSKKFAGTITYIP